MNQLDQRRKEMNAPFNKQRAIMNKAVQTQRINLKDIPSRILLKDDLDWTTYR